MASSLNLSHSASTDFESHVQTKTSASTITTAHSESKTSTVTDSASHKPSSKTIASGTASAKSSAHTFATDKVHVKPLASAHSNSTSASAHSSHASARPTSASVHSISASAHPTSKVPHSGSLTSKVSSSLAHSSTHLPKRPLSQQHIASAPASSSHSLSSVSIQKAAQSATLSPSHQSSPIAHSSVTTSPPVSGAAPSSQSQPSAARSSSLVSFTHQAGPVAASNSPNASSVSVSSSAHSSAQVPSAVLGLKTSTGTSVTQQTSVVPTTSPSSSAGFVPSVPVGTAATDTIPTFHPSTNAFMSHKATAGGILAVAAILAIAIVAAVLLFCRRKYGRARAERHRRWRRGISWPASHNDSDGGFDPFLAAPRLAPTPPMTEMSRDAYISRSSVASPMTAIQPNPFDRLARPAPIATSAVLSQRLETPTNGNFGYPFRTMYPDQPLDTAAAAGAEKDKDDDVTIRDNASVHSSPSLIQSSPSIYAITLPEEDADSLYVREAQTSRPAVNVNVNPFVDPQALTSPSTGNFNVVRKPVPPIPPRHRSRPSLTGSVITPVLDNSLGLGLTMPPTTSQSEEHENPMMTPTRRTFLNIRPKRVSNSNSASSTGEAV